MRERHPKKEGERALIEIEAMGWTVARKGKYFRLRCGCPGMHQTYVHLSPSNPNYFREKIRYCRRICER